jgi:undecaprenyl-diphosphatase
VIFSNLLKVESSIVFDIVLHIASTLAVFIYFRKKLWDLILSFFKIFNKQKDKKVTDNLRYIGYLVAASIPAAFFGIIFEDKIEQAFSSLIFVGYGLIFTAVILFSSDRFSLQNKKTEKLNIFKIFLIGIAQALAIFPGISRSGSTVAMGLFNKIDRKSAAEFSFMLSIPIIIGAFLFKLNDIVLSDIDSSVLFLGGLSSFLASYVAIASFIKINSKYSLKYFAGYCFVISILVFINTI